MSRTLSPSEDLCRPVEQHVSRMGASPRAFDALDDYVFREAGRLVPFR